MSGGRAKIRCPKCGRILGDTNKSIDCVLNCPKCNAIPVKITVVGWRDYDIIKLNK